MVLTQTKIENFYINIFAQEERYYKENYPKLICVNWTLENDISIKRNLYKKFQKLYNLDANSPKFIKKDSLDKRQMSQNLLLLTIKQIDEYIAKKRKVFNLPLDLNIGTNFQKQVWYNLQKIPYGKTISYKQLAQNIDNPSAYRAVANANGKNPFSIIVPCHRVIANHGTLGGYTGGIDKKIFLLNLEKEIN